MVRNDFREFRFQPRTNGIDEIDSRVRIPVLWGGILFDRDESLAFHVLVAQPNRCPSMSQRGVKNIRVRIAKRIRESNFMHRLGDFDRQDS